MCCPTHDVILHNGLQNYVVYWGTTAQLPHWLGGGWPAKRGYQTDLLVLVVWCCALARFILYSSRATNAGWSQVTEICNTCSLASCRPIRTMGGLRLPLGGREREKQRRGSLMQRALVWVVVLCVLQSEISWHWDDGERVD